MNTYGSMMVGDQFRTKMESTFSPKSSPHGGRSPVVSRQDSSGTLKTTISLGKTPTIIQTGPFYSMKEAPVKGELTGDKDLMTEYGLHHTLTKFKDKKVKESLGSFLPNLPGIYEGTTPMELKPADAPDNADDEYRYNKMLEMSTLRSIIEKPPIGGKELIPLTAMQLAGFRLHPGALPKHFRSLNTAPVRKHKNKHKKQKHKDGQVPQETNLMDSTGLETYEKKHKKQKRHEDDKERKKRKKEKKRKKKSHSPEPSSASLIGSIGVSAGSGSGGIGNSTSTTPGITLLGNTMPLVGGGSGMNLGTTSTVGSSSGSLAGILGTSVSLGAGLAATLNNSIVGGGSGGGGNGATGTGSFSAVLGGGNIGGSNSSGLSALTTPSQLHQQQQQLHMTTSTATTPSITQHYIQQQHQQQQQQLQHLFASTASATSFSGIGGAGGGGAGGSGGGGNSGSSGVMPNVMTAANVSSGSNSGTGGLLMSQQTPLF